MLRGGLILCIFLAAPWFSGCHLLEVSTHKDLRQSGVKLNPNKLRGLTAGETRRQDVLEFLGPPDGESGNEQLLVYSYQFDERRERNVRLVLLFSYHGEVTRSRVFHVSFKDDVVERAWYESSGDSDRLAKRSLSKQTR